MRQTTSILTVLSAVVVFGCAPPAQVDIEAERAALREAVEAYHRAGSAVDAEALIAFYAQEALVIPPSAPESSGPQEIRDFVTAFTETPGFEISFDTRIVDISADGSLGYRQMFYLAECRAIELLDAVQPARTRHIGDAVFGEKNVHELLVALGFLRQAGTAHAADVSSGERVLAGGLGRLLAIDIPFSDAVDVWAEAGRVRLSVQARGDFTADGVEDVLIFAGVSRSRYRPKLTHLCAITRDPPGAPLRLIE
ncbi:MAG: nuclear transport factor 2 family protein, partial [Nitrospirae bacterium]|nr:nuclear transport factor 2 family protein [Nitrospirota bacterium]